MAIGFTARDAGTFSSANTTSYTGTSYTPSANALLLAYVVVAGSLAATPTFSGNGLTWTMEFADAGLNHSQYIFSALTGSSPSTGAVTIDVTGDAGTGCAIYVAEFSGVDLTTPVVQTDHRAGAAAATPLSNVFTATASDSAIFTGLFNTSGPPSGVTVPAGYTSDVSSGFTAPIIGFLVAHHLTPGSITQVTWGSTSGSAWRVAVVEVKAAPPAAGVDILVSSDPFSSSLDPNAGTSVWVDDPLYEEDSGDDVSMDVTSAFFPPAGPPPLDDALIAAFGLPDQVLFDWWEPVSFFDPDFRDQAQEVINPLELQNTAEGGTNGVAVSTANSGGASGNAWTLVQAGTGGSLVFDNTVSDIDTLAYAFTNGGTQACFVEWGASVVGTRSKVETRLYIWWTGEVTTINRFIAFRGAGALRCSIQRNLSGQIELTNGAAVAQATSTVVPATGAWNRFEVTYDLDASLVTVAIYTDPNSLTPAETLTWNAPSGTVDVVRFGDSSGATANPKILIDNIGVSTNLNLSTLGTAPVAADDSYIAALDLGADLDWSDPWFENSWRDETAELVLNDGPLFPDDLLATLDVFDQTSFEVPDPPVLAAEQDGATEAFIAGPPPAALGDEFFAMLDLPPDPDWSDPPWMDLSYTENDRLYYPANITYREMVLTAGPIAYWRFGETAGTTAYDETGHGHDLTYALGVGLNDAGPIADYNPALRLDTNGDIVNQGTDDAAFDLLRQLTLEAWVRWDSYETGFASNGETIITKLQSINGWQLMRIRSGSLRFATGHIGTGLNNYDVAWTPTVGAWHYIVATWDGTTKRLYVDGAEIGTGSAAVTNQLQNSTADVRVGNEVGSASQLFGGIDEVAVYGRGLSAAEVAAHFAAATAPSTPDDSYVPAIHVIDQTSFVVPDDPISSPEQDGAVESYLFPPAAPPDDSYIAMLDLPADLDWSDPWFDQLTRDDTAEILYNDGPLFPDDLTPVLADIWSDQEVVFPVWDYTNDQTYQDGAAEALLNDGPLFPDEAQAAQYGWTDDVAVQFPERDATLDNDQRDGTAEILFNDGPLFPVDFYAALEVFDQLAWPEPPEQPLTNAEQDGAWEAITAGPPQVTADEYIAAIALPPEPDFTPDWFEQTYREESPEILFNVPDIALELTAAFDLAPTPDFTPDWFEQHYRFGSEVFGNDGPIFPVDLWPVLDRSPDPEFPPEWYEQTYRDDVVELLFADILIDGSLISAFDLIDQVNGLYEDAGWVDSPLDDGFLVTQLVVIPPLTADVITAIQFDAAADRIYDEPWFDPHLDFERTVFPPTSIFVPPVTVRAPADRSADVRLLPPRTSRIILRRRTR